MLDYLDDNTDVYPPVSEEEDRRRRAADEEDRYRRAIAAQTLTTTPQVTPSPAPTASPDSRSAMSGNPAPVSPITPVEKARAEAASLNQKVADLTGKEPVYKPKLWQKIAGIAGAGALGAAAGVSNAGGRSPHIDTSNIGEGIKSIVAPGFRAQQAQYGRDMRSAQAQAGAGQTKLEGLEKAQKSDADIAHTKSQTGYQNAQTTALEEEGKRSPKGNYIIFGGDGIWDASEAKVVREPTNKLAAEYIEIDPAKGKALGIIPDAGGKYRIPKEGIGPYLSGQSKPTPQTTNEFESVLKEFTKPDGSVDYAGANAEYEKRLVNRAKASRPPGADHGVTMIGGDGKVYRLEPGQAVPAGARTAAGVSTGNNPTTASRGVADQARGIRMAGDNLIKEIDAKRKKLGNLGSYWDQAVNQTPIADADISGLMTSLSSFAALQPKLHGFRSHDAMREFARVIGGVPKNAEALKASIRSIINTAEIMERMGRIQVPGESPSGNGGQQGAVDPDVKAYADQHFGGDIARAQAAIAEQLRKK